MSSLVSQPSHPYSPRVLSFAIARIQLRGSEDEVGPHKHCLIDITHVLLLSLDYSRR